MGVRSAADSDGGPERSSPVPNAGEVRARRVLFVGFLLMIVLLGTDGFVGFRSLLSIRGNVSSITDDQFRNVVLIMTTILALFFFGVDSVFKFIVSWLTSLAR